MGTSSAWTPERRAKQAEAIRRNRPWDKSTGPRTAKGKAVASRNADKGVRRELTRARERRFRAQLKLLRHLIALDGIKPLSTLPQTGRKRRRTAKETARYEEELARLQAEVDRLTGLLALVE